MSNLYFDYKVIGWRRIHLSDEADKKQILKILQENANNIKTPNDLPEYLPDYYDYIVFDEVLYEITEDMTPEMNEGEATVKFHDNSEPANILWDNSLNKI